MSSMLYSVQAMLFKAGGQVGEVPEAVCQVWLPGAPCGTCCCKGRPRMRIRGAILPSGIVRMPAARKWFASGLPPKKYYTIEPPNKYVPLDMMLISIFYFGCPGNILCISDLKTSPEVGRDFFGSCFVFCTYVSWASKIKHTD